jgi:PAS domain-containing protein
MQDLDNLTKNELLDLVRTLEHRLEHSGPEAEPLRRHFPLLDIAAAQALMQQRLAAIVESSYDAVLSWSMDGTVASWNESAQVMLGYSAEEIGMRIGGF